MQEYEIKDSDAGQRLDQYLARILPDAPKSFFYKMLRRKNITLNRKKAEGAVRVQTGDTVTLWLADETIAKFRASREKQTDPAEFHSARAAVAGPFPVIYEDETILVMNKPAGILSQKAAASDLSMNEAMLGYLLESGHAWSPEFKPGVCNRLDRNTSGLLLAGLTLPASRVLNDLIRTRAIRKFYHTVAAGSLRGTREVRGWLKKDAAANRVTVSECPPDPADPAWKPIETVYRSLKSGSDLSFLEIELITGRAHQIRAHLSAIGHPIAGDQKYGDPALNHKLQAQYGVRHQLLHACRIEFPKDLPELPQLAGRVFTAPLPEPMKQIAANI